MKINSISRNIILLFMFSQYFILITQTLDKACGIQFCRYCDSSKTPNFCSECDLPYKPVYSNQSVCSRCSNNCLVCKDEGNNSKVECLSCQANYNFSSDKQCNTFYIWVYAAVIGGYAFFVILVIFIFCILKKMKKKQKSGSFYELKQKYDRFDQNQMSQMRFEELTNSLLILLKQASSYRHFKFFQEQSETPIKLTKIKMIPSKKNKMIKKILMKGVDNSQWKAKGYVFPQGNSLKFWFLKQYEWQVQTDKISKHIVYQSKVVSQNGCQGVWYFYDHQQFNGQWSAKRVSSTQEVLQQIKSQDR